MFYHARCVAVPVSNRTNQMLKFIYLNIFSLTLHLFLDAHYYLWMPVGVYCCIAILCILCVCDYAENSSIQLFNKWERRKVDQHSLFNFQNSALLLLGSKLQASEGEEAVCRPHEYIKCVEPFYNDCRKSSFRLVVGYNSTRWVFFSILCIIIMCVAVFNSIRGKNDPN